MDVALALAAENGLLTRIYDDERKQSEKKKKKKNEEDDAGHHQSEKKQKQNNNEDGEEKKKKTKTNEEELESVTVVFKVDFHCHGCRRRIFEAASSFRGVETVMIEEDKNKLTVVGKVDPLKLHEKLETSLKKKIDFVSPQPKKKNDDHHNNSKQKKPKEPPLTTVVLKISLHCDGCRRRIRQILRKTEGVHSVDIDREKELVTMRGAMDPKAVQMRLKTKMKRSAEIVPAKKDKDKANGEKMEQCNGGAGNQKQQKCQKMCCCCNSNSNSNGSSSRGAEASAALMDYYGPIYGYAPVAGYVVERLHAPQIFSDENPNACSIM